MNRRAAKGGKAAEKRLRKSVKSTREAKTTGRRVPSVGELQRQLTEALEREAAASEVLKVISNSPNELDAVFKAILGKATRICEATFGNLFLWEGGAYRAVAVHGGAGTVERWRRDPTIQGGPKNPLTRLAVTKKIQHVADIRNDEAYVEGDPTFVPLADMAGARTLLMVPMLKENEFLGALSMYREEVRPFSDKQIELVQNFAAQAVIAIENTRLLNELRQRTDDLTESLEQQTATSEVLKVISSSPGDLQPVFDAMIENATRLCGAQVGTLVLYDGSGFRGAAVYGHSNRYADVVSRIHHPPPGTGLARLEATRQTVHAADIAMEGAYDEIRRQNPDFVRIRTGLFVPIVKQPHLIGAFMIYRHEVRPFTEKQIELVQNFAAQAVIAIENTRLLNELRESLQQQTATADVLKVISSSPGDLTPVFETMLENATRICEAQFGQLFKYDDGLLETLATRNVPERFVQYLLERGKIETRPGSVQDRVVRTRATVHIADLDNANGLWTPATEYAGARAYLGVPMLKEGEVVGTFGIYRTEDRPFTDKQIELVQNFAAQAVIAIENTRLLSELRQRTIQLEDKGRELAEASQHKSQFLANMSHELRTPLNAILGYTELIADGIYGQPSDKMIGVLKRLESNGKHLLGLINAVLDLSKIEAGQLTLDLADYSLKDVVQTVFGAVEPLAADKKLKFMIEIAPGLPQGHGDERRLTQVLLNLVGNAIKFTDAGEVLIKVSAADGSFSVAVCDTGPGIAASDQTKLFQEFQQADNSITRKKGGTGLGLAISKRIIEMHGGRIWVESVVGQGSIFSFTLAVRVERQVEMA